jgi:hypothetical protein
MLTRLRSTWLAGAGAILLAIAVSGAVAASSILTAISAPATDPPPVVEVVLDTAQTFEDVDGDGVDDDCDDAVAADEGAAAAAEVAADLDGDGTISVSEAAHTDWSGGTNCNHGGYVNGVARADGTCDVVEEAPATEETASVVLTAHVEQTACETPVAEPVVESKRPAACVAATSVTEPVVAVEPADLAKNAHGQAVSEIAQSEAVGGKNCNHGGAVSEAAKNDQAAAKLARDAKKAEQKAARDARKDAPKSQQKTQHKDQHATKAKGG